MKQQFILVILLAFGCSQSNNNLNSLKEYQYPLDELNDGKTFIFQNTLSKEKKHEYLSLITKNNQIVLSGVQSDEVIKFDSTIRTTEYPPKLLETYYFEYDTIGQFIKTVKGEIIEELYFKNNSPYSSRESTIKYKINDVELEFHIIDSYIKDTSYIWNGVEIPALYFDRKAEMKTSHSYIPFMDEEMKFNGYTIYAKNIGLIKYGVFVGDEKNEWELVMIK